ncbi:hypothetical protein ACQUW5_01390 [Legionella sp. CNM-1927-20]|uniref:hypothetical protein n=1 Tax=Legionella sp. CNM-1927-20 TaxID=3422221 RepID=UPI00403AF445
MKSYIFKKAMSITPPVELSLDEKNEIANFLDTLNFDEVLTTSDQVTQLTHSEKNIPSEANQQSVYGFFDKNIPDQDKNEESHTAMSTVENQSF